MKLPLTLAGDLGERNAAQDDTAKLNLPGERRSRGAEDQCRAGLDCRLRATRRGLPLNAINGHLHEPSRPRGVARQDLSRTRRTHALARPGNLERESRSLHVRLQEEQRLSMLDALTGIPNRAAYDGRIEQEFRRWKRFWRTVGIPRLGHRSLHEASTTPMAKVAKAGRCASRPAARQARARDRFRGPLRGREESVKLLVGSRPRPRGTPWPTRSAFPKSRNLGFHSPTPRDGHLRILRHHQLHRRRQR